HSASLPWRRDWSAVRHGAWRTRLYRQSPPHRPDETHNDFCLSTRRRDTLCRSWLSAAPGRAALVFLEKREMGARIRAYSRGRARLLGTKRLPHLRRSVERTKV